MRSSSVAALDLLAPRVLLPAGVTQRLGDVADRRLRPVADDVGDLRGVLAAVQPVDVLDGLLAPVGLDVDVDVRRLATLGSQEPLEHQSVEDGIDGGDLQRVADRRVGRRSPALAEDRALAAEPGDVPDDEEVAGKVQLLDDGQLMLELLVSLMLVLLAGEALGRAGVGELAQVGHLGVPGRHRERRQVGCDELERKGDLGAEAGSVGDGAGPAGEALGQLGAGAQVLSRPGR
jgi:hypothetical protein